MKTNRGFTLIELLTVLAIVAILLAVAVPAFNDQIRKSRRSQAMQALSDLQLRQERWRTNNTTYTATLNNLGFTSATLPGGHYSVALATPGGTCANTVAASNANSFSITATAIGAQAADTRCATLTITSLCGVVSKTATGGGPCW